MAETERADERHSHNPVVATLVAILGTTISPYLFFWQASQEVMTLAGLAFAVTSLD